MRRLAAVALLLALAACRGQTPADNKPVIQATTQPGSISLTSTGAVTITFSGKPRVQWINSGNAKVPQTLHLLSIAVPDEQTSGTYRFRAGFNLYGYDGSSTATIPVTQAAGLKSIAYLELLAPSARRFSRPLQECTLQIRNGGRSGTLACPALADEKGAHIALIMRWSLT